MKIILFYVVMIGLSLKLKAEFSDILHHTQKVTDIHKIENKYVVRGAGPLLVKIDADGKIHTVYSNSNNKIFLSSIYKLDSTITMLYVDYGSNAFKILETKKFDKIDTLFEAKTYYTPVSLFPLEKSFLMPAIDGLAGEIVIYSFEDGVVTEIPVYKGQNNIASDFIRLSNSKIVALGTGMETSSIFISEDNGKSFDEIDINYPMLYDLDLYDGDLYAFGVKGHMIKSINQGQSWELIYENTTYDSDGRLQVINKDTIYACSSIEGKHGVLLRTTNGGDSWEDVYKLENERFTCFLIDGNKAFIGTYSGKILYNDNFTSVQEWQVIEPNSLKVFPNPSTDYLTIDTKEKIELFKIVDMLGNDVTAKVTLEGKTLDLTALASGTYTLVVDGKTAQVAVSR